MNKKIRFVVKSILLIGMILNHGCSGKNIRLKQIQFNKDASFERSNLNNINRLFQQMKTQKETSQDYYFVLIGDSRNLVRSYKLNGFNFLAKQIYLAKDSKGKKRIFDKIKFIIHLGDFIYNGAEKMQWINLQRGFSQKDYAYDNYPYLKILVESKPIFPVLGNHEIMKLRLRRETPYRNLADSNKGLNYFKQFFNWDNFIANANIISPIPGDLPEEIYRKLYLKLGDEHLRKNLDKHYILKKDGHYYLRIYQEKITKYTAERMKPTTIKSYLDKDKKQQVINDLYEIFKSLGYNVLPVLSSDSMICYAFEIDNMVYLVLDSMSRGWHYNNFTEIKKALYKKKDQHSLHLFSRSDLNGQYEFFKAIADYVKKNDKKLVPFMHHSPFNSHNKIDKGGIEYNLKLMLGVEYHREKSKIVFNDQKNNTFLDDIIFLNKLKADQPPDPEYFFTSCVHYFEKFNLAPRQGDQEFNKINWYITGGGGGELTQGIDKNRLKYATSLYNKRLLHKNKVLESPDSLIRSIEISQNKIQSDYHFLIVHVRAGKIVEVYPQFVGKKELHINPSTIFSNVKYTASTISSPAGFGNSINIDFFRLGFDKISPGLAFITWEPGTGFGGFNYDTLGNMNFVGLSTFRFLKFGLNFPRSEYTVTLLGSATLLDQKKVARDYLTVGIEAPVLYNFFGLGGVAKKWALGVHFLFPRKVKEGYDPDFGKDIKLLVDIIYKF